MKKILTRILAIVGTVLVLGPSVLMIFTGIGATLSTGEFRVDYLIPAEAFLIEFAGALLLLWAAFWAHSRKKAIGIGIIVTVVSIAAGMVIASMSGLASGAIEPTGIWWALVVVMIALFTLALIEVGIAGILLTIDVFKGREIG